MAPAMATARLRKELLKLQKEPPPDVIAEPDESNILKWHYAVRGAAGTPFEGGVYVGKLIFPNEYPMKPPGVMMLTPSGRFKTNTRLCLSMSDFHPESWNPMWSVATIIQGVQSFMASDELTTGGLKSPVSEHRKLAAVSMAYNEKFFPTLFGGNMEEAFATADRAREESEKKAASNATNGSISQRRGQGRRSRRERGNIKADEDDEESHDKATTDQVGGESAVQEELSPEEIEKRRKRNAKKRAKQKAKKAATKKDERLDKANEDKV